MKLSSCRSDLQTEPRQFYFQVLKERLARLRCAPELVSACYEFLDFEFDRGGSAKTLAIRGLIRFLGALLRIIQIEAEFGAATRESAEAALLAFITGRFVAPRERSGSACSGSVTANEAGDGCSRCPRFGTDARRGICSSVTISEQEHPSPPSEFGAPTRTKTAPS